MEIKRGRTGYILSSDTMFLWPSVITVTMIQLKKVRSDRNTFNGAREIHLMSDGNKRWYKKVHCFLRDHLTPDLFWPLRCSPRISLPSRQQPIHMCKEGCWESDFVAHGMAERLLLESNAVKKLFHKEISIKWWLSLTFPCHLWCDVMWCHHICVQTKTQNAIERRFVE